MEKTTLYAYVSFIGNENVVDFPLEVLTERLGVQPTETWRVGDKVNINYSRVRSFTCWKYESETLETLDVDDVLLPILNVFQSKTVIINQLKKELNLDVRIELVIAMIDGYTPGLVISPEFSSFAAAIDAYIDIDMYVRPFSEPEVE
ncbi:DUF4279 domain-containing protein [Ureibacillus sp. Re31]|uniref:DUF4279 domain-containing protein n=1 Tax=Ureibacillus galli TaxID=2762222 RepID=A0ABR8XDC1_9BACL|nr:DUF4279 domain-containing protein [Ureibacillus galli]MBD8027201.1 DUF4279 domain-containing protein [Ureibacillus galli]